MGFQRRDSMALVPEGEMLDVNVGVMPRSVFDLVGLGASAGARLWVVDGGELRLECESV